MLARQLDAPTEPQLFLARPVVNYIFSTTSSTIFDPKSSIYSSPLFAFADFDCAGCKDSRHSTSKYLVAENTGPVIWASKQQSVKSVSSVKAEYVTFFALAEKSSPTENTAFGSYMKISHIL